MRKYVVAVLGVGLMLSAGVVRGATPPENKCAQGKQTGASKKVKSKLICWSKAAAKAPFMVDPLCLTKAEGTFDKAWLKAGTSCADPGNGLVPNTGPIEASVDACVQHIVDAVPGTPATAKCTSGKIKQAGVVASSELLCYAKAAGKGVGVDPNCVSKAELKLQAAVTKADGSAPCPGTFDEIKTAIDGSCVVSIANQLPGKLAGCGNGVPEPGLGENCDDGDALNGNACPASCHIDPCTPVAGTSQASVTYVGPVGTTISGLEIFVDYPEGKVGGLSTTHPFGVTLSTNDLGYGFLDAPLKLSGLPTTFETLHFANGCQGAPALVAADFGCTVIHASDNLGNPVSPALVTCSVTVP